jgi:hypothetical protein
MTDNLRIWSKVEKTNPAHTKHVNQRGGFTAVSANYQILAATEQFGPIGEGWGYVAGDPIFHETLLFVQVTLWHGNRSNTFGPMLGSEEWKDSKGRIDSDAGKKATTDAVTKLLSQLGFNADVFLGKFDDQKYVDQMTREFAEKVEVPASVEAFLAGLKTAYQTNSAEPYWTEHWPAVPKDWRPYALEQKEQIKAAQGNVALLRAG